MATPNPKCSACSDCRCGPKPYMNPYLAGVLLGIVLYAAFLFTGHGLGASGGMARVAAAANDTLASSSIDQAPYLAKLCRVPGALKDNWVVWLLIGSVLGALLSGLLMKRVRPEVYKGPHISVGLRLLCAFIGGAFMGYGSQWGRGCTSGQALSGGASLAAGSWAFMFAVFGGAYLLAYPLRRLWK